MCFIFLPSNFEELIPLYCSQCNYSSSVAVVHCLPNIASSVHWSAQPSGLLLQTESLWWWETVPVAPASPNNSFLGWIVRS